MRKVYVIQLISLLVLSVSLPIHAYDFEFGGVYFKIDTNNTVSVTRGDIKYKGDVVIPSKVTYNGTVYSVTSVGSKAFNTCYELVSVTIPNSVTSIGYMAFFICSGLTSVTIPNSVISIGSLAFAKCINLKSLKIPNSVVSIGEEAFGECSSLTSLTIPNSVTTIEELAFYGCSSLISIVSEIKNPFEISGNVFKNSYSTATLTVPVGTKPLYQSTAGWKGFQNIVEASEEGEIGQVFESGVFFYKIGENNTVSVVSGGLNYYSGDVVIPNQVIYYGEIFTVTSIGSKAFSGCNGLTSITIPHSVTFIGNHAFLGCSGLTSVIIPNNVTTIGAAVFYKCSNLISVTIPNGVISIGEEAFEDCSSLLSVTIPNSVTTIDQYAFQGCSSLISIVSEIKNPFEISGNVFKNSYSTATLTVPVGTKSLYQSTAGWKGFQNIVEANSDEANFSIDGVTYQGTKSAKTVVVKSVDTYLASIKIPASVSYDGVSFQVTGMDNDAFKGSGLAALVWDIDAALPNNAFNNASIGSNFLLYVKSASYAPSSVKNVVVNGTASSIQLSDDGGLFYCPQAFKANSITYTHNYSMETGGNGKGWETIALPFDVQRIVHSTRGEIVPFAGYSSGSNQKPFWLASFSASGFKRASSIQAYEPYIIAMPNNSKYNNDYNLAGDVTFSADNVQVAKTPSFSGLFLPAFSTVPQSSTVYALNVSNRSVKYSGSYEPGSRFISSLRDVRPFEAYMTGSSSTRGVIGISFEDGTTDMEDIMLSAGEDLEVTIYTLSGQQVAHTTQRDFDQVWSGLSKGVYIVIDKKRIK